MIRGTDLFPDNWIYIHDSNVALGRVQNFGNWSPEMVPDPETSCLGLEYFCFEGDNLWSAPDHELIESRANAKSPTSNSPTPDDIFGRRRRADEEGLPGLRRGLQRRHGDGPRVPQAPSEPTNLQAATECIATTTKTIPMLTAMLAARNILGAKYDLWQVNVDQEYHEEGKRITLDDIRQMEATQPLVPRRIDE